MGWWRSQPSLVLPHDNDYRGDDDNPADDHDSRADNDDFGEYVNDEHHGDNLHDGPTDYQLERIDLDHRVNVNEHVDQLAARHRALHHDTRTDYVECSDYVEPAAGHSVRRIEHRTPRRYRSATPRGWNGVSAQILDGLMFAASTSANLWQLALVIAPAAIAVIGAVWIGRHGTKKDLQSIEIKVDGRLESAFERIDALEQFKATATGEAAPPAVARLNMPTEPT